MNKTHIIAFGIAVALGASSLAVAQEKKAEKAAKPAEGGAPPAPALPADVEAYLKDFVGTWKCEATFPAGAMGPGSPEMKLPAAAKIKKDMNGLWYTGTYEVKKSKGFPGMKGLFSFGSDGKQALFTIVDTMGSFTWSSGPVSGDSLTLSGEGFMMGQKVKIRETFQKKGAKEAAHKLEVDMGKGFMLMGEDNCKK